MKIIASHNPDAGVRAKSSSGGVFSMLAEATLGSGGTVYGAAFDGEGRVVHVRVTGPAGLERIRGSKYVYSSTGSAMTQALADLEQGRPVLFSGTPCQVAAMRKRVGENQRLLLVEVVCHGAPEPRYWERYLAEFCHDNRHTPADIRSINFRDKSTGWRGYSFTVGFTDGSKASQRAAENPYMRAFIHNFTLRKACFRCPFKYPDGSAADITLGDFWGIESVAPEIDNNLGTTIVIARTRHGEDAISLLPADGTFTLEQAARFNPAILHAPAEPARFDEFAAEAASVPRLTPVLKKYAGMSLLRRIRRRLSRIIHRS